MAVPEMIGPLSSKISETDFACLLFKTLLPAFSNIPDKPVKFTSLPFCLSSATFSAGTCISLSAFLALSELAATSVFVSAGVESFDATSAAAPSKAGLPFKPALYNLGICV